MSSVRRWGIAGAAGALLLGSLVALAQAPGIKRTILQRADLEGNAARECVLGMAEIAPGGSAGKHIHHGIELGYVSEGEAELLVDGEPPRRVKAGDSWVIPALRPHDARNTGAGPLKVVATYAVEKGKPLSEPVK